ncbi:MAG: hypothetical protein IPO08_18660 [Xanthomonadales bacterium]|nr:hypothetical protein [Xanthomonadales bacterium]
MWRQKRHIVVSGDTSDADWNNIQAAQDDCGAHAQQVQGDVERSKILHTATDARIVELGSAPIFSFGCRDAQEARPKDANMRRPHNLDGRFIHWFYCTKCGLVELKNEATRRELKKACPGAEKED